MVSRFVVFEVHDVAIVLSRMMARFLSGCFLDVGSARECFVVLSDGPITTSSIGVLDVTSVTRHIVRLVEYGYVSPDCE